MGCARDGSATVEDLPSLTELARLLGVPMHALQTVLDALEHRQLLVQGANDPPVYLPGRDPSLIAVTQVVEAVRAAGEERFFRQKLYRLRSRSSTFSRACSRLSKRR
jgi:hypothetical protein